MGAETYYIDKITEALENYVVKEEDKEFDSTILYGSDSEIGKVLEAAGRYPMMSDKRLVILKEAQTLRRAKEQLDKLKAYVARPNYSAVLCIVYKGDSLSQTSPLLKECKKNQQIEIFDSPKIKEYKLGEVVKDYCSDHQIRIEDKAIELLVSYMGSSLSSIFTELEKLEVSMHKTQKIITSDLINEHTGFNKEFNVFELKDSLAKRDYFHSLNILKYFEENPNANPTVLIISTIFGFFQKLLIASFNKDKNDKALMEVLSLKTPYALREIRTGMQSYNAYQIVEAIHSIRDFDAKSKGIGSTQNDYSLLKELILRLLTL